MIDAAPGFDVLSDVLQTARLHSSVMGRLDLRAPWALRMREHGCAVFHLVVDGGCAIELDGHPRSTAARGDVLVMTRGRGHVLRDTEGGHAVPIELGPGVRVPDPGDHGGPITRLVCGTFRFEDRHTAVLLANLPEIVHVEDLAQHSQPWLAQTLAMIDREHDGGSPGASAIAGALCDALFLYLLRSQLASAATSATSGWLGALRDPQVGEALRLMHAEPAADWSVAALASRVAMSRSAFATRFTEMVGTSPLQYLIAWRTSKAASLLRGSQESIAAIALRVGYDSEAAFNKAFKRTLGVTPGAYRRGAAIDGPAN
ncbi:MAG TPA: AraC family transcriptional regulator [Nannocystaceae bacterium]|nr:AraC family transcriptional regulator [Nannocystaceae bacterium]